MVSQFEAVEVSFEVELRRDLCRLARFGANISDSHSCLIFLPEQILRDSAAALTPAASGSESYLALAGYHSLSREIMLNCRLACSTGLIGWVAKHQRGIHVSPFDRDSRTLGIYSEDQQLKSFIGIPVTLPVEEGSDQSLAGVIACDSRKSFAFSKLQGKLLEDLAQEVANAMRLHMRSRPVRSGGSSWQEFLAATLALIEGIGRDSVELVRMRLRNFDDIEAALGTSDCLRLVAQMQRIIRQSLPANFPMLVLTNGDIIVALDVMTSSLYENRISAICERLGSGSTRPLFTFSRKSLRDRRYRNSTLENVIADTAQPSLAVSAKQGELYEFRRA